MAFGIRLHNPDGTVRAAWVIADPDTRPEVAAPDPDDATRSEMGLDDMEPLPEKLFLPGGEARPWNWLDVLWRKVVGANAYAGPVWGVFELPAGTTAEELLALDLGTREALPAPPEWEDGP